MLETLDGCSWMEVVKDDFRLLFCSRFVARSASCGYFSKIFLAFAQETVR